MFTLYDALSSQHGGGGVGELPRFVDKSRRRDIKLLREKEN